MEQRSWLYSKQSLSTCVSYILTCETCCRVTSPSSHGSNPCCIETVWLTATIFSRCPRKPSLPRRCPQRGFWMLLILHIHNNAKPFPSHLFQLQVIGKLFLAQEKSTKFSPHIYECLQLHCLHHSGGRESPESLWLRWCIGFAWADQIVVTAWRTI